MNLSILPNLLTMARFVAVPPLVWMLLTGQYRWALVLAVAAGLSDLLDGWIARRYNWQSRFGGLADPLADKFMMLASYLTLAWLAELPWWLVWLILSRDLVIVIGGIVYHFRFERVTAEPTQLSRFNTFCQVLLLWFVLVHLAVLRLPSAALDGLVGLVAALCVMTLIQYVWIWTGRAVRISRARRTRT